MADAEAGPNRRRNPGDAPVEGRGGRRGGRGRGGFRGGERAPRPEGAPGVSGGPGGPSGPGGPVGRGGRSGRGGRGFGRGRGRGGRGRGFGRGRFPYYRNYSKPVFQNQETDVFVKQLPTDLDQNELKVKLEEQFAKFGTIVGTKMSNSRSGRFFFSVQYESADSAKRAITELNGMKINGQDILVETRRSRIPLANQVYVGGLVEAITDEALENELKQFGNIIQIDRSGNKAFAIIYFETADAAKAAIEKMNGATFQSQTLNVHENQPYPRRFNARARNANPNKIFVGGFGADVTEDTIKKAFNCSNVEFRTTHAYLTFDSEAAAKSALDNKTINGTAVRVEPARF